MKEQKIILNNKQIKDIISKLALEIQEHHPDLSNLILVGILSAGYPLAKRITKSIYKSTGVNVPIGKLDIALYRDDLLLREDFVTIRESNIPYDIRNKTLIIIDDVLFHARTIRAALNAVMDFGTPAKVELAVLIDRGFRELPIIANYIGQEIKTKKTDYIQVDISENENKEDKVILE
jgi:pyrimidine operon attenuation protein / uracil phosphoribosyltransferase